MKQMMMSTKFFIPAIINSFIPSAVAYYLLKKGKGWFKFATYQTIIYVGISTLVSIISYQIDFIGDFLNGLNLWVGLFLATTLISLISLFILSKLKLGKQFNIDLKLYFLIGVSTFIMAIIYHTVWALGYMTLQYLTIGSIAQPII